MSTSTLVMASGWHSGISSCVRLAARIPAMRAAPSTSPFLASPLSTMSSVLRAIRTKPSASATRSVAGFADTSTMCASPLARRCVSFLPRAMGSPLGGRGEDVAARKQHARGVRDIGLAHQALADQEGRDAGLGEPRQIVRRRNTAFADGDMTERNPSGQALAGLKRRVECPQVAIVDADEPRFQPQRAFELPAVVHFDQRVHAERESGRLQLARAARCRPRPG